MCDLFVQRGPEAPTLCEGWSTADLAAHLVVRERRPDTGPGLVWPPLAGYTDKVRCAVRDRTTWEQLVDTVRCGPPWLLRPFDGPMNTVEFFIHTEDVRRGGRTTGNPGRSPRKWPMPCGHASVPAGWRRRFPPRSSSLRRGDLTRSVAPDPASPCPVTRASSPCSVPVVRVRPGSSSAATQRSRLRCALRRSVSDLRRGQGTRRERGAPRARTAGGSPRRARGESPRTAG